MTDHDHITLVTYNEIARLVGYRFGDDGTIWSRRRRGGGLRTEWRLRRPVLAKSGRLHIRLREGDKWVGYQVHRLILEAFRGPCPAGLEACHNDGNPLNNRLDNLRWDTHVSNMADQARHGTRVYARGSENPSAKLTAADRAMVARLREEGRTCVEIARSMGVCVGTISKINAVPQLTRTGARNHKAKLTEADIPEVRRLHREGMGYNAIGRMFGLNGSTVKRAVTGETWREVADT